MLVVGLTGGIATGKSTVSNLFKSHNIPIIDADLIAREVVLPGTPTLGKIVKYFGEDILLEDGTLNRPKLGSIIFNDAEKRRVLNGIVHPAVKKAMFWSMLRCWWRGERVCIMDVPLLIESGLWQFVGKIVVVYCSPEIQLHRLMNRDGSSRTDASSRLNSQKPIAEKLDYADLVIDNSGSIQDLQDQMQSVITKLYNEAGWTWRVSWLFPPWAVISALSTLLWRTLRRQRRLARQKKRRDSGTTSQ
ncbi:CoaE-domain-containing protein [Abortiporus biennis]|nr:CoaE-domain-containing protein [Abortiporus biennis]